MQDQIETLLENIKADYFNWTSRNGTHELSTHNHKMIEEFNNGLEFTEGKKYIKILSKNSVWGFIVNTENDKMFQIGDILKPAGFKTPARNKARGNIVNGEYSISWTGPDYLRG